LEKSPCTKIPIRIYLQIFLLVVTQIYIFAQVMGGLVGAALVYANYIHAIDIVEGGRSIRTQTTASLFSTYAVSPPSHHARNNSLNLPIPFSVAFYDQRLVLFLRIPCHRSPRDCSLRHDRQEKFATTCRACATVSILPRPRHRHIPWNGDRWVTVTPLTETPPHFPPANHSTNQATP
jgi:hypothetical protein